MTVEDVKSLKDLRQGDDKTLEMYGLLQDWNRIWELELHKITHTNKHQERWSLSKRSYFQGFLRGLANDKITEKKKKSK